MNKTRLSRNVFHIPVHKLNSHSIIAGGNARTRLPKAVLVSGRTQHGKRWWSEPSCLQSFRGSTTRACLKAYLEASCVRIRFLIGALEAMDTSSPNTDTIFSENKVFTVLFMITIFEL